LASRIPLIEVFNNLGVAQARRGKKSAVENFQRAVEADSHDADYLFNLALALYRTETTLRLRSRRASSRWRKLQADQSDQISSDFDSLSCERTASASPRLLRSLRVVSRAIEGECEVEEVIAS